jgi:hypothetical protein
MSTALGINAESIVVIGITGGSVTIQFAILPDANFQLVDGTDGQFAFDPADKLTQLAAMVADPGSDLYTKEGSKFIELGQPINTPAAIPAASQGASGELTKERCHSGLYSVLLTPCVLFQMRSTLWAPFEALGGLQRQAISSSRVFGPQLYGRFAGCG